MFLVEFEDFVKYLEEDVGKQYYIKEYVRLIGDINKIKTFEDFKQTSLYKDYLGKFSFPIQVFPFVKIVDEFENDIDWDLFLRLIIGSFSSLYKINYKFAEKAELIIIVNDNNEIITKAVQDLSFWQIKQTIFIYLEEQIRLELLLKSPEEDVNEKKKILDTRKRLIDNWEIERKRLEIYYKYVDIFLERFKK